MEADHRQRNPAGEGPVERENWLPPELREFDILDTTQAGAAGVTDAGIFS